MVKPRENRVPMMLSDEELAAIEDWRFANRIGTRSEAIRRLCQLGIQADKILPQISHELRKSIEAEDATAASLVDRMPVDKSIPSEERELIARFLVQSDACHKLFYSIASFEEQTRTLRDNKKIEAVLADLQQSEENLKGMMARWQTRTEAMQIISKYAPRLKDSQQTRTNENVRDEDI